MDVPYVPPLAPYPPADVRSTLPSEEWQACLDAWIFCLEFRLRLSSKQFRHLKLSQPVSGAPFLLDYLGRLVQEDPIEVPFASRGMREEKFQRYCFLLVRRLLLETDLPYDYASAELFELIGCCSSIFRNSQWKDVLKLAWKRSPLQFAAAVEFCKGRLADIISNLPNSSSSPAIPLLSRATALVVSIGESGETFMTGADYVDSLIAGYNSTQGQASNAQSGVLRTALTKNLFLCFSSLIQSDPPKTSLLLDHFYALKSTAESLSKSAQLTQSTLLSSLVCSTVIITKLDILFSNSKQTRGNDLLRYLRNYREQTLQLHTEIIPETVRLRARKGKGRAKAHEVHIHSVSKISQIHDLFPDVSNSYALNLLDYFNDDIEAVTAALLEPESLPRSLQHLPADKAPTQDTPVTNPPPILPARRRNVFDNDDFDNLKISSASLHRGRRPLDTKTIDSANDAAHRKAAILSALAAFDSDDDERDDTYDVADVGGTVDSSTLLDTDSEARRPKMAQSGIINNNNNNNEELLFRAWKSDASLFARDSKTRLQQPRAQLRRDTGLDNEQLEGWALTLGRDGGKELARLEARYSDAGGAVGLGGNQRRLAKSKWQANSGTGTEDDDEGEGERDDGEMVEAGGSVVGRGGGYRGGRGASSFGAGGRGTSATAGPSGDKATQAARRRKEQGRGRGGANHSRREGRARKMGRGMAGPTS